MRRASIKRWELIVSVKLPLTWTVSQEFCLAWASIQKI